MHSRRTKPPKPPTEVHAPLREVSEAVLVGMQRGKISALEEVFDLYGGRVFAVCLGILGNRNDAEDVSQEVFLRAYQQAKKFSGRSRFSTWLMRLASNHALNRAKSASRRRRISEPLVDDVASRTTSAEEAAIARERRAAVSELLQKVPLEQRQVLVLREMEGLSYAELADLLSIPIGTVTSRLIRGREKLRTLAIESGFDPLENG